MCIVAKMSTVWKLVWFGFVLSNRGTFQIAALASARMKFENIESNDLFSLSICGMHCIICSVIRHVSNDVWNASSAIVSLAVVLQFQNACHWDYHWNIEHKLPFEAQNSFKDNTSAFNVEHGCFEC